MMFTYIALHETSCNVNICAHYVSQLTPQKICEDMRRRKAPPERTPQKGSHIHIPTHNPPESKHAKGREGCGGEPCPLLIRADIECHTRKADSLAH